MLHWLIPLAGNILALGGLGFLAGPAGLALLLPRLLLNLKADIAWVLKRPLSQIISGALVIACAVLAIAYSAEKHHSAKLSAALVKCDKARAADRTAYEQAQKDAAAKNKAEVAAREAQSQRISDNAKTAYARDLAELRRLHSQPRTAQGSAGPAHPPESGPAPGGADADGLRLSADEHLQASEIELRLMHLQNWVSEQLKAQ